MIASVILVGLFALQHCGTHKVAFLFAPIVFIWLFSIFGIGLYNIICWNPKIVHALSPHYIVKYFKETGKDGWISLGGILLCTTGTQSFITFLFFYSCKAVHVNELVNFSQMSFLLSLHRFGKCCIRPIVLRQDCIDQVVTVFKTTETILCSTHYTGSRSISYF